MKELLKLQGGYPRNMDYLLNLQTEMLAIGNGVLSGAIKYEYKTTLNHNSSYTDIMLVKGAEGE